jgi:hypothetical protein
MNRRDALGTIAAALTGAAANPRTPEAGRSPIDEEMDAE